MNSLKAILKEKGGWGMAKINKIKILELVGVWSFFIGLVIAVILGATGYTSTGLLLALGVIVGLLNIADHEIVPFLVACIALIIAGSALGSLVSSLWLMRIVSNVVVLIVPAAVIASFKAVYALASTR